MTKEKRLKDYKEALNYIKTHDNTYCGFSTLFFFLERKFNEKSYPELWKYKPETLVSGQIYLGQLTIDTFWFSTDKEGMMKRVEILEEIINEMEK